MTSPSQGVEDKYENTLYELRAAMALLWQSLTYVPYVIQWWLVPCSAGIRLLQTPRNTIPSITQSKTNGVGDIYYANLEPHLGCEQGGIRPVLVVQNNVGNKHSKTLIVSALTSRTATKAKLPTHVFLDHIPGMYARIPSLVLLEQIHTLDKSRLLCYIGSLSDSQMKQVNTALKCSLEL